MVAFVQSCSASKRARHRHYARGRNGGGGRGRRDESAELTIMLDTDGCRTIISVATDVSAIGRRVSGEQHVCGSLDGSAARDAFSCIRTRTCVHVRHTPSMAVTAGIHMRLRVSIRIFSVIGIDVSVAVIVFGPAAVCGHTVMMATT